MCECARLMADGFGDDDDEAQHTRSLDTYKAHVRATHGAWADGFAVAAVRGSIISLALPVSYLEGVHLAICVFCTFADRLLNASRSTPYQIGCPSALCGSSTWVRDESTLRFLTADCSFAADNYCQVVTDCGLRQTADYH